MLRRLRRWRLVRSYQRIRALEDKLHPDESVAELRKEFAAETIDKMRGFMKQQGASRQQVRKFNRGVVKGA